MSYDPATVEMETTFAARALSSPVEVCTSTYEDGEPFYLLHLRGETLDMELTTDEARALRNALGRAIQLHEDRQSQ